MRFFLVPFFLVPTVYTAARQGLTGLGLPFRLNQPPASRPNQPPQPAPNEPPHHAPSG